MATTAKRMTVKQELELIRKRHRGILRPADVVEFAANEKTALHNKFTWDDTAAAHQHRLWEARQIIRVTIVQDDALGDTPMRPYISLLADRKKPRGGYRAIVDVIKDDKKSQAMLIEAEKEYRAFERKYRRLATLVPEIIELGNALRARSAHMKKPPKRRKVG